MADRIRSVHSSSRSRTRAPTLQFGRSFNLLRLKAFNHEVVIGNSEVRHWQAHNIDRARRHPPQPFQEDYRDAPALQIPFFCPVADMPAALIRVFGGWQMERLSNDHQSQRALAVVTLGMDTGDGALCVFRKAIAGGGRGRQWGRSASRFAIGKRGTGWSRR